MPENVTFRVTKNKQHLGALLDERAQAEGKSSNELASELVYAGLMKDDSQKLEEIQEELRSVHAEVGRLRQGLGAAMEVMLTRGLSDSEAEAVREHLKELFAE